MEFSNFAKIALELVGENGNETEIYQVIKENPVSTEVLVKALESDNVSVVYGTIRILIENKNLLSQTILDLLENLLIKGSLNIYAQLFAHTILAQNEYTNSINWLAFTFKNDTANLGHAAGWLLYDINPTYILPTCYDIVVNNELKPEIRYQATYFIARAKDLKV